MPELPIDLLRQRIRNELLLCEKNLDHSIQVDNNEFSSFPIRIRINLKNVPGPIWEKDKLAYRYNHEFVLEITRSYPYQKPVVRWKTAIFHPNIMPPEDGGYVCTKLLDQWSFGTTLLSFIKGIESLLANPNPRAPFGTDSCTKAAEYLNKHQSRPPMVVDRVRARPKIISSEGDK